MIHHSVYSGVRLLVVLSYGWMRVQLLVLLLTAFSRAVVLMDVVKPSLSPQSCERWID